MDERDKESTGKGASRRGLGCEKLHQGPSIPVVNDPFQKRFHLVPVEHVVGCKKCCQYERRVKCRGSWRRGAWNPFQCLRKVSVEPLGEQDLDPGGNTSKGGSRQRRYPRSGGRKGSALGTETGVGFSQKLKKGQVHKEPKTRGRDQRGVGRWIGDGKPSVPQSRGAIVSATWRSELAAPLMWVGKGDGQHQRLAKSRCWGRCSKGDPLRHWLL